MSSVINFNIELPKSCFTRIEEMSSYDNNYYKIHKYGDWLYGELDILYQGYDECYNCYTYELGKMVNGVFKPYVTWNTNINIFNPEYS